MFGYKDLVFLIATVKRDGVKLLLSLGVENNINETCGYSLLFVSVMEFNTSTAFADKESFC